MVGVGSMMMGVLYDLGVGVTSAESEQVSWGMFKMLRGDMTERSLVLEAA